jgi:hypothetical protein
MLIPQAKVLILIDSYGLTCVNGCDELCQAKCEQCGQKYVGCIPMPPPAGMRCKGLCHCSGMTCNDIEEEAESLGTRMAPWSRVSGWTDSIDQAMKELQAAWQLAKGIPVAYCRIKPSTLGDEMTDSTALCSGPGSPHRGVECIRRKSPRYGDVFEYIGSAFCCLSCKETEKTSEVLAKCTWSKRWR